MGAFLSCEFVRQESVDVWSFGFKAMQPQSEQAFDPGRFVMIDFPDVQGNSGTRCYSISGATAPDTFEISVRRKGDGGVSDNLVRRLQPGALVNLVDVAGQITSRQLAGNCTVLMLAAGIGVTVPIALVRDIAKQHLAGVAAPKVRLVIVTPVLECLPFLAELLSLSLTAAWFELSVRLTRQAVVSGHSCFAAGRPTAEEVFGGSSWDSVVICGGLAFADFFQAQARNRLPHCTLFVEAFSAAEAPQPLGGANAVAVKIGTETVVIDSAKNLLTALEEQGVSIQHQCRAGICGRCRIKVVDGDYRSSAQLALSDKERQQGYVLACCTFATGAGISIETAG